MLLQSLNALSFAPGDPSSQEALSNLTAQLAALAASCDRLMETLLTIVDQRAQIQRLQDAHVASALAISLRKLNGSYGRRVTELKEARGRIAELQAELERFYLERYAMWFSRGLFGLANSQVPMVNMYDDHDIIDGFGSYPHHFMKSPVFSGLGNVAFKYYMLFQHHMHFDETSIETEDPSWVLGTESEPYIKHRSKSICTTFGKRVVFCGLDCRAERTLDRICYPKTYDAIFQKLEEKVASGNVKHLILLLGMCHGLVARW